MGNIHNLKVIRQCLNFIENEDVRFPLSDHYVKKLTVMKSIRLFIASQLGKWESYDQIALELQISETLQDSVGLPRISASQLSRRLRTLPTEALEALFLERIAEAKSLMPVACSKTGPIRIIDSTCLKLPATLSNWAYVNRKMTQIKIHVRVVALPKGQVIPEKAIPTTGNVHDAETMDLLVEDDGTIYVMDRGYVKYKQFDAWLESGVRFVNRINEKHGVLHVEKEMTVPKDTPIVRDVIVRLGSAFRQTEQLLRLVEFVDDQGRKYRIVTSCFDLSAAEIADIYRQRWLIELFFKWMKQHLRLVKLYSYEPQGVWNQIFLALIAYAIAMCIQLKSGTKLSLWDVLSSLRSCWDKEWTVLEAVLHPKPSRPSKGRQKVPETTKQMPQLRASVGIMKPRKAKLSAKKK